MSDRNAFIASLREGATKFDYNNMETPEIIMSILKKKGVSEKLTTHPEFKKQVSDIFSRLIDKRTGSIENAVADLETKLSTGFNGRNSINTGTHYEFNITQDGNFEFDAKEYEYDENNQIKPRKDAEDEHKFFTVDEGGNLTEIETAKNTYTKEYDIDESGNKVYNPELITDHSKTQKVFDRSGLQMEEIESNYSSSDKKPYRGGQTTVLKRNQDLATGSYTVYDDMSVNTMDVDNKQTRLNPSYRSGVNMENATIEVIGQHPEYLGGSRPGFEEISDFNKKAQERRSEHGTEAYEQLLASSNYKIIPQPITPDEKKYCGDMSKNAVKVAAQTNQTMKKAAEQRGIVTPEEEKQQ